MTNKMFLTMIVFSAIREGKVVGKEVMSVHKKVQVVGTKKEGAKKRIKLTKSVRTARRLVLVARGFRFLQKSEELLDSRLESEEQEEEQEDAQRDPVDACPLRTRRRHEARDKRHDVADQSFHFPPGHADARHRPRVNRE